MNVVENEQNIFKLDPRLIREKLESDVTIKQATVKRILPDTLSIEIKEKEPRARLFHRGKKYLLTKDGLVLPYRWKDPEIFPQLLLLGLKKEIKIGCSILITQD